MCHWGIQHRLTSAHFPQSNGRVEVAVKTAKRLLMSNKGPSGSLNHDRILQVMLQLWNTPDQDCSLSPAEIVFGHPLRDTLSFINRLKKYSNPHVRLLWCKAWKAKDALYTRMSRTAESLKEHSRPLRPLSLSNRVFLQNQRGPHPNKWDRSGTIVEIKDHDQCMVKIDGSGRSTLRNSCFLPVYTPVALCIPMVPEPLPPLQLSQGHPPLRSSRKAIPNRPSSNITGLHHQRRRLPHINHSELAGIILHYYCPY